MCTLILTPYCQAPHAALGGHRPTLALHRYLFGKVGKEIQCSQVSQSVSCFHWWGDPWSAEWRINSSPLALHDDLSNRLSFQGQSSHGLSVVPSEMRNRVLLQALLGAAAVSAREVPATIRSFYNSLGAAGSCCNKLATGFYASDDGPDSM
jgi:hypothetical protein